MVAASVWLDAWVVVVYVDFGRAAWYLDARSDELVSFVEAVTLRFPTLKALDAELLHAHCSLTQARKRRRHAPAQCIDHATTRDYDASTHGSPSPTSSARRPVRNFICQVRAPRPDSRVARVWSVSQTLRTSKGFRYCTG
jgi:hypothetical protein